MDEGLQQLIQDYLAAVLEAAAELLVSGIPLPDSRMGWASSALPKRGVLASGRPYVRHGYGCIVGVEPIEVDFEFGERGESNGFDGWRLAKFSRSKRKTYSFTEEKDLEQALVREAEHGRVVKRGTLYYLTSHAA